MGQVRVTFDGSFYWSIKEHTESAKNHGHAHAVEQMINHLKLKSLPLAIAQDLDLAGQGVRPDVDFGPTVTERLAALKEEKPHADVDEEPDTT